MIRRVVKACHQISANSTPDKVRGIRDDVFARVMESLGPTGQSRIYMVVDNTGDQAMVRAIGIKETA